jgi:starch-binding outer membrane protein, SusD/RagB family
MKMKKILIALLASVFILSGCEDFFENEPVGSYSEDNFYKNINEMQNALDAVYSVLREKNYQLLLGLIGDGMSDDFVYEYSVNQYFGYDGYRLCTFQATSDNYAAREWYSINYRGIFRANMLLKHINDSINLWYREGYDDSNIRKWQSIYGQALFLRAFYYFNLVRSYGGVPLMPESPNYVTYNIPRSSVDSVYAYIEKDLRTAAILLPIKFESAEEFGQATRYAALAYLMKVAVYQAKPGIPSDKWQEASKIGALLTGFEGDVNMSFKEILKPDLNFKDISWDSLKTIWKFDKRLSGISTGTDMSELSNPIETAIFQQGSVINTTQGFVDWGKMWRLSFQSLETNGEPIFVMPAVDLKGISVSNTYNYVDYLYGDYYYYAPPLVPTMSLVNEIAPATDKEPRKYYGVVSHNMNPIGHFASDLAGESAGGLGTENNFYQCIKRWLHSQNEREIDPSTSNSLRNVMLMRYSEVVLFYAEALNECGDSKTAIDVLNKIRENLIASPTITNDVPKEKILTYKYAPYSMVREDIYHERRMELMAEFDRFFDIVRQGRAEQLLNYAFKIDNSYSKQGYFIRGKNEVLPIPQNEIDLSHGVIVQNPGY